MMLLLILAPSVLLMAAVFAIIILQWRRPSFGFAWLIATSAALAAWLVVLFLRFRLPETIQVAGWQPASLFVAQPIFIIDRYSWPYAAGLATLALAVILTEPARTQSQAHPMNWAGSLALTAAGLFAILAGNPFILVVDWTLIDLAELAVLLGGSSAAEFSQRIVVAFGARLMGSLSLVWAMVSTPLLANSFDFSALTPHTGLFILIAAGLRLGVLPLHLPFSQEPRLRRGMGTVLRLAPIASSLVLLGRIPPQLISTAWAGWLLALTAVAAFYSAAKWLTAEDELAGRPYWLVGLAALAIQCVVNGKPLSGLAWGLALLLPGGLLFLYSARRRDLFFLPLLGLWGLLGLPFSPAASGWEGFLSPHFSLWSFLALLAQVLFVLGYIRHAFKPGNVLNHIERWVQVVYPAGLVLVGAMAIVVGIWGWPGSRTLGVWWLSAASASLVCLISLAYWRWTVVSARLHLPSAEWFRGNLQKILFYAGEVLRLDWLYRLIWFLYGLSGRLISAATAILEGDGGVLWAFLLLALLVSLASQGMF